MKTAGRISLVIAMGLLAVNCKNEQQPELKTVDVIYTDNTKEAVVDPKATYAKVEFSIEGMTCEMGCAKTIEKKMAKMDGVKSAKVDFHNQLAMVEYDEAKVTTQSLEATVKKAGEVYEVKGMKQVEQFSNE